jgi:hypothetical protein
MKYLLLLGLWVISAPVIAGDLAETGDLTPKSTDISTDQDPFAGEPEEHQKPANKESEALPRLVELPVGTGRGAQQTYQNLSGGR